MVQALDVAILVNNVGASHDMPVSFAETEAEEIENIVQTVSVYPLNQPIFDSKSLLFSLTCSSQRYELILLEHPRHTPPHPPYPPQTHRSIE